MKVATGMLAGLAATVAALTGCPRNALHDSVKTVVNRSAPQTLVLTNAGADPLTIGTGATLHTLTPGASLTLSFEVTTLRMEPKPAGTASGPAAYIEQFGELDQFGFVDTRSDPLVVSFRKAATPVKASFSVNLCPAPGWQEGVAATHTYTIVVPDPVPGVPQAVCP